MPQANHFAQTPADFYKGKNVELYIGYSVGGGFDLYARVLARHIGKYIPGNPTVVPKNMEGAGSLRLANWLAKVAPRDGTVFGTFGRGVPFYTLLGLPGPQFKATDFSWIGSASNEVSMCVSWGTSKITKIEDVLTTQMIVGGTGASDDTVQFPRVLSGVLGTKLKVVPVIRAATTSFSPWNAARSRGVAVGRGRRSSPPIPTG